MERRQRAGLAAVVFTSVACGNGNGGNDYAALRETINVDLEQVDAFLVTKPDEQRAATPDAAAGQLSSSLVALTESGDLVEIYFVDCPGYTTGGPCQPDVNAIFPFPTWIFFSVDAVGGPLSVDVVQPDGGLLRVDDCVTIASHRDSGRLFCAPLEIRVEQSGDSVQLGGEGVYVNAVGDLGYLVALDSADQPILYRLALDAVVAPVATLVDATLHPQSRAIDAAGDLYAWVPGTTGDDPSALILPASGGEPVVLSGDAGYAMAGKVGEPDQDTFYRQYMTAAVESQIGVIREGEGGVFAETLYPVAEPSGGTSGSCEGLYRLRDGLYMHCFPSPPSTPIAFARVVAGGEVIGNPTMSTLGDIDNVITGGNSLYRAEESVVFLAEFEDTNKFVRYDGEVQEDIPLDPDINILSMSVSRAGDIKFRGVLLSTNEAIIGSVAAGSDEVVILSSVGIEAEDVVVFTPIN